MTLLSRGNTTGAGRAGRIDIPFTVEHFTCKIYTISVFHCAELKFCMVPTCEYGAYEQVWSQRAGEVERNALLTHKEQTNSKENYTNIDKPMIGL